MVSDQTPPAGGVSISGRDRLAVWALAVAQTIGYACFFYIFAALVLSWHRDLGWDESILSLGPLLAILVTALVSPRVGRLVDQGNALRLMGGGTLVGAISLCTLALATHPAVFLLAFAGLGAASATSLYEVCFALMIRRFGDRARTAITKVTLVAGLASTLAFPAGAWLSDAFGWRVAVWCAAFAVLGLMLPLQLWGASQLGGGRPRGGVPEVVPERWRVLLAKPGAMRLMILFALLNLDHWMIVNLFRPIMDRMAVSDGWAILAASLIGPSQVAGRMALMVTGDRLGANSAARMTVAAMVLAATCLLFAGQWAWALVAFAVLQGAAMGVLTILRPVLVAGANGPRNYAAAAALIGLPALAAVAIAPSFGTALLDLGGPTLLISTALGLAILSLATLSKA